MKLTRLSNYRTNKRTHPNVLERFEILDQRSLEPYLLQVVFINKCCIQMECLYETQQWRRRIPLELHFKLEIAGL